MDRMRQIVRKQKNVCFIFFGLLFLFYFRIRMKFEHVQMVDFYEKVNDNSLTYLKELKQI